MYWVGINDWIEWSVGLVEVAVDTGVLDKLTCRMGFLVADISAQSLVTGLEYLVAAALE